MADVSQDVQALAAYLCVSCGKVSIAKNGDSPCLKGSNGTQVRGLASICKYLVRQSNQTHLLGNSGEEQALVAQWLEYRVTNVDRCASKLDIHLILKDLNHHLADRVYFLGHQQSLADLVLYYGLHCILNSLEHADRQNYLHVSRWFDNMQHVPGIRQAAGLTQVPFIKTAIYPTACH